ncbi:hypothetical protein OS493_011447 [Desmophyllum pertusum]|uniref:F5/8 type C domain-containing protein n=1 Tax=Desmophyllum pertusum TaxID=174260 RepID=A0A9W9YTI6_9CNID|nr:hypothetical protein OS493_011447 [Desmophyllum pertusum]
MDDEHRTILRCHRHKLMRDLELNKLLPHLTEVLDSADEGEVREVMDRLTRKDGLPSSLQLSQPFLADLLLQESEVQHRPRGYALEQENNGTQEQRHKSRNQNKESQSLKDDHEINNNAAGFHYDTISFSGSVYNVTIIANIQGDVQTFRNKFNRSRQRFEELDKRINPNISSHRKARVVSSRVKDELEEVEQQFQEIEEETTKPVSPEQVKQEAADLRSKVRKLEEKMELIIERDLNELRGYVQQDEQINLEKSKSIHMDNSRDKQHSSMATTSTAKGRRARCSVNEAAIRLPEIKTVQRRDGKRRETPYKRTFSYKRDFDKKGGVIYYLGKIPPPGRGWNNPAGAAVASRRAGITIQRTSGGSGKTEQLLEYFKPEPSCTGIGKNVNSWWGVDFGENYTLLLKDYTLRHGTTDGQFVLSNWRIEGKLDGPLDSNDDWTMLKEHTNEIWDDSRSIPSPYMTKTWHIEDVNLVNRPFRYFRIVQLNKSRKKGNISFDRIYLSGMELYGDLYEK